MGTSQVTQQIGQTAGVILVPVGEDDAVDLVGALSQVRELRQDQVHPGHVRVGEHDAAVEDDDAAVDFDAGTVATPISPAARPERPHGREAS